LPPSSALLVVPSQALARKWNLHKEPGFWSKHRDTLRLAMVLAEHGSAREAMRREAESRTAAASSMIGSTPASAAAAAEDDAGARSRRASTMAGDAAAATAAGTGAGGQPPLTGAVSSGQFVLSGSRPPGVAEEDPAAGIRALRRALRPYDGDMFSQQGDYSDSLLYLSRQQPRPDAASYAEGKMHEPSSPTASKARAARVRAFLSEFEAEGKRMEEEEEEEAAEVARAEAVSARLAREEEAEAERRQSARRLRMPPSKRAGAERVDLLGERIQGGAGPARQQQQQRFDGSLEDLAGEGSARYHARRASMTGDDEGSYMQQHGGAGGLLRDEEDVDGAAVGAAVYGGVGPPPGGSGGGPPTVSGLSGGLTMAITQVSGVLGGGAGPQGGPALRRQCAVALRDLSRRPAARPYVLAEGAQRALLSALQEAEDDATRLDCLAALCNLTAVPSARASVQAQYQGLPAEDGDDELTGGFEEEELGGDPEMRDAVVSADDDFDAVPEPTLDAGVVATLADFARAVGGGLASDPTDMEVRCMLSTALLNITATHSFRGRAVAEGIVPALLSVMAPVARQSARRGRPLSLGHAKASLREDDDDDAERGVGGGARRGGGAARGADALVGDDEAGPRPAAPPPRHPSAQRSGLADDGKSVDDDEYDEEEEFDDDEGDRLAPLHGDSRPRIDDEDNEAARDAAFQSHSLALAAADAFCLACAVRGLCNLSGTARGAEALMATGTVPALCGVWDVLPDGLRCAVASHLVYNLSRTRSTARKLAEEGGVLILRDVIVAAAADGVAPATGVPVPAATVFPAAGGSRETLTPERSFALRRSTLALCRLTRDDHAANVVLRSRAVLALCIAAMTPLDERAPLPAASLRAQAADAHVSPLSADPERAFDEADGTGVADSGGGSAGGAGGGSVLSACHIRRRVAGALCRLSWRADRATSAMSGVGAALASLLLCGDGAARKVALTAAANLMRDATAAACVIRDGLLAVLVAIALPDSRGGGEGPVLAALRARNASVADAVLAARRSSTWEREAYLAFLTIFNASCHDGVRRTLLKLRGDDVVEACVGLEARRAVAAAVAMASAHASGAALPTEAQAMALLLHDAPGAAAAAAASAAQHRPFSSSSGVSLGDEGPLSPLAVQDTDAAAGDGSSADASVSLPVLAALVAAVQRASSEVRASRLEGGTDEDDADATAVDPLLGRADDEHHLLGRAPAHPRAAGPSGPGSFATARTPAVLSDGFEAPPGAALWHLCQLSFSLAAVRNLSAEHGYQARLLAAGCLPRLLAVLRPHRRAEATSGVIDPAELGPAARARARRGNGGPSPAAERKKWECAYPLHCVADAIHAIANLAHDVQCRAEIARGGTLEALVPVAEDAPSSVLAVALDRARDEAVDAYRARADAVRAAKDATDRAARMVAELDPGAMTREEREELSRLAGTRTADAALDLADSASQGGDDRDTGAASAASGGSGAGGQSGGGKPGLRRAGSSRKAMGFAVVRGPPRHPPAAAAGGTAALSSGSSSNSNSGSSPSRGRRASSRHSVSRPSSGRSVGAGSSGGMSPSASRVVLGRQSSRPRATTSKASDPRDVIDEATEARVVALARAAFEARTQCAIALSTIVCSEDSLALTDRSDDAKAARDFLDMGVLDALNALCKFGSDGDEIRARVVGAMRALSQYEAVAAAMLQRRSLLDTLVRMLSSSVDSARREAVAVICNLSMAPGLELRMVESGVVRALMVAALLRTHDPVTQARCIQALHNLLASADARGAVLKEGVIWALQRLALSTDKVTQRSCAVTLHRLATDRDAQSVLVREGGIRSVISVLLAAHGGDANGATAAGRAASHGVGASSVVIRSPQGVAISPGGALSASASAAGFQATGASAPRRPGAPVSAGVAIVAQARAPGELEQLSIMSVLNAARRPQGRRGRKLVSARSAASAAQRDGTARDDGAPAGPPDDELASAAARGVDEVADPAAAGSDPVVGAHFAGVLAAVSREPGNEAKLVAEGAVEALVLLCQASFGAGAPPPLALSASGAPGDPIPSRDADGDGFTDEGQEEGTPDLGNLRPSCAVGLFNLSATPNPSTRARVVAGGTPGVFVRLALSPSEDDQTRRLSALGLVGLLWGSGPRAAEHCTAVLEAGAVHALVALAVGRSRLVDSPSDGAIAAASACAPSSTPSERYAVAAALQFLSTSPDAAPYLCDPASGGIETLAWLASGAAAIRPAGRGAPPGGADRHRDTLLLDAAAMAAHAIANLSAMPGCAARILAARAAAPVLVGGALPGATVGRRSLPSALAAGPQAGPPGGADAFWPLPVATLPTSDGAARSPDPHGASRKPSAALMADRILGAVAALVIAGSAAADALAALASAAEPLGAAAGGTDGDDGYDSDGPDATAGPAARRAGTAERHASLGASLGPPTLRALLLPAAEILCDAGHREQSSTHLLVSSLVSPWSAELGSAGEAAWCARLRPSDAGATVEDVSAPQSDTEALQGLLDACATAVACVVGNAAVSQRRADELRALDEAAAQEHEELYGAPYGGVAGNESPRGAGGATSLSRLLETPKTRAKRGADEAARAAARKTPRERREAELAAEAAATAAGAAGGSGNGGTGGSGSAGGAHGGQVGQHGGQGGSGSSALGSGQGKGGAGGAGPSRHEMAAAAAAVEAARCVARGDWVGMGAVGASGQLALGAGTSRGPLGLWAPSAAPLGVCASAPSSLTRAQGPVTWTQCEVAPSWLVELGAAAVATKVAGVGGVLLLARAVSPRSGLPRAARLRAAVGLRFLVSLSPLAVASFVGAKHGGAVRAAVEAAAVVAAECRAMDIAALGDVPRSPRCTLEAVRAVTDHADAARLETAAHVAQASAGGVSEDGGAPLSPVADGHGGPSSIVTAAVHAARLHSAAMPGSRDAAAQVEAAKAAVAEVRRRLALLSGPHTAAGLWGLAEGLAEEANTAVVRARGAPAAVPTARGVATGSLAPAPTARPGSGLSAGNSSALFGGGFASSAGSGGLASGGRMSATGTSGGRRRGVPLSSAMLAEAEAGRGAAETARLREELALLLAAAAEDSSCRSALVLAGAGGALVALGAVHDDEGLARGPLVAVGVAAAEDVQGLRSGSPLHWLPSVAFLDERVQRTSLRGLCNMAIASDAALQDTGSKRVTAAALSSSAMREGGVRAQVRKLIAQRLRRMRSGGALDASPADVLLGGAGPGGGSDDGYGDDDDAPERRRGPFGPAADDSAGGAAGSVFLICGQRAIQAAVKESGDRSLALRARGAGLPAMQAASSSASMAVPAGVTAGQHPAMVAGVSQGSATYEESTGGSTGGAVAALIAVMGAGEAEFDRTLGQERAVADAIDPCGPLARLRAAGVAIPLPPPIQRPQNEAHIGASAEAPSGEGDGLSSLAVTLEPPRSVAALFPCLGPHRRHGAVPTPAAFSRAEASWAASASASASFSGSVGSQPGAGSRAPCPLRGAHWFAGVPLRLLAPRLVACVASPAEIRSALVQAAAVAAHASGATVGAGGLDGSSLASLPRPEDARTDGGGAPASPSRSGMPGSPRPGGLSGFTASGAGPSSLLAPSLATLGGPAMWSPSFERAAALVSAEGGASAGAAVVAWFMRLGHHGALPTPLPLTAPFPPSCVAAVSGCGVPLDLKPAAGGPPTPAPAPSRGGSGAAGGRGGVGAAAASPASGSRAAPLPRLRMRSPAVALAMRYDSARRATAADEAIDAARLEHRVGPLEAEAGLAMAPPLLACLVAPGVAATAMEARQRLETEGRTAASSRPRLLSVLGSAVAALGGGSRPGFEAPGRARVRGSKSPRSGPSRDRMHFTLPGEVKSAEAAVADAAAGGGGKDTAAPVAVPSAPAESWPKVMQTAGAMPSSPGSTTSLHGFAGAGPGLSMRTATAQPPRGTRRRSSAAFGDAAAAAAATSWHAASPLQAEDDALLQAARASAAVGLDGDPNAAAVATLHAASAAGASELPSLLASLQADGSRGRPGAEMAALSDASGALLPSGILADGVGLDDDEYAEDRAAAEAADDVDEGPTDGWGRRHGATAAAAAAAAAATHGRQAGPGGAHQGSGLLASERWELAFPRLVEPAAWRTAVGADAITASLRGSEAGLRAFAAAAHASPGIDASPAGLLSVMVSAVRLRSLAEHAHLTCVSSALDAGLDLTVRPPTSSFSSGAGPTSPGGGSQHLAAPASWISGASDDEDDTEMLAAATVEERAAILAPGGDRAAAARPWLALDSPAGRAARHVLGRSLASAVALVLHAWCGATVDRIGRRLVIAAGGPEAFVGLSTSTSAAGASALQADAMAAASSVTAASVAAVTPGLRFVPFAVVLRSVSRRGGPRQHHHGASAVRGASSSPGNVGRKRSDRSLPAGEADHDEDGDMYSDEEDAIGRLGTERKSSAGEGGSMRPRRPESTTTRGAPAHRRRSRDQGSAGGGPRLPAVAPRQRRASPEASDADARRLGGAVRSLPAVPDHLPDVHARHDGPERSAPAEDVTVDQPAPRRGSATRGRRARGARPAKSASDQSLAMRSLTTDTLAQRLRKQENRAKVEARKAEDEHRRQRGGAPRA